jgi:putative transposase
MWAEKSRERLATLRSRSLSQADWLAIFIDGVWLTREVCVVVAIGIDTTGRKQVLDFELGPSESVTAVTALMERLAARGVEAKGRRLLVGRDGRPKRRHAMNRWTSSAGGMRRPRWRWKAVGTRCWAFTVLMFPRRSM